MISERELAILQHSLGVDRYGRGRQYRNRFVTGDDSTDWDACQRLVKDGLMLDVGPNPMMDQMHLFYVTDKGKAYVAEHSPKAPKRTRSQQRYENYLKADSGLSFKEWLLSQDERECVG